MDKREFLEILREALSGEVNRDVIEQNIRYYDQYLSSDNNKSDTEIIDEIGDPRLIAKTIIESEKISKSRNKYTSNQEYNNKEDNYYEGETNGVNKEKHYNKRPRGRSFIFNGIKWYHKAAIFAVLILVLIFVIFIGRIILSLIFMFGIPLLLIVLLISLFRRR